MEAALGVVEQVGFMVATEAEAEGMQEEEPTEEVRIQAAEAEAR